MYHFIHSNTYVRNVWHSYLTNAFGISSIEFNDTLQHASIPSLFEYEKVTCRKISPYFESNITLTTPITFCSCRRILSTSTKVRCSYSCKVERLTGANLVWERQSRARRLLHSLSPPTTSNQYCNIAKQAWEGTSLEIRTENHISNKNRGSVNTK